MVREAVKEDLYELLNLSLFFCTKKIFLKIQAAWKIHGTQLLKMRIIISSSMK